MRVPQVHGLFTQVRRLDQVEAWVLDAASMLDDQPTEGFQVTVVPQLDQEATAALEAAAITKHRLHESELATSVARRKAAHCLATRDLPVRDIGHLLGVSFQRAHQLLTA